MGSAPIDVPGNDVLQFELKMDNTNNEFENAQLAERRKEKLARLGAFRVLVKQKGNLGRRVFNPVWSQKVHTVKEVIKATVEDTEGEKWPTREVLPVPKGSQETRLKVGGSAETSAKRRLILNKYAERALEFVIAPTTPSLRARPMSLGKLATFLRKDPQFPDDLKMSGVSLKSPMMSFLKEFPELFKVTTPKAGGTSIVELV